MFVFLSFKSPVFLTKDNLLNLLYSNSGVGIAACAVTLVVIGGNFDLSLGGIYILSALLAAWAAVHWNIWLAFPVALAAGAAMGLINGLLVTKLRVNAFLATLASGLVFFGIDKAISGGQAIYPGPGSGGSQHDADIWTFLGQNKLGSVQYAVIIFVVVAIVLQIVLARTVFGRHIYGVGGNRDAARLSGLKVDRIVITTFVIAGFAAGLAGLIDYSALGAGLAGRPDEPGHRPHGDRRRRARRHEHLRRRRLRVADRARGDDARPDHERVQPARGAGLLPGHRPGKPDRRRRRARRPRRASLKGRSWLRRSRRRPSWSGGRLRFGRCSRRTPARRTAFAAWPKETSRRSEMQASPG